MARLLPQPPQPPRNCAWMTDAQLLLWIQATSGYLEQALADARERGLLPQAQLVLPDTTAGAIARPRGRR